MAVITSSPKEISDNITENSEYFHRSIASENVHLPETNNNLPIITVSANANAINALIDAFLPPIVKKIEDIDSDDFTGIGIKASIKMAKPSIAINGSNASGTANLSIHLQGGVKFLETWNWVTISIPDTQLTLGLYLEKDELNKTVLLKFTNVKNINISLEDIPNLFEYEKHTLMNLFNEIINSFKGFINSELSQFKIPLFQLPDTFPGTDASSNFQFHDISITDNRIQALINISG